MQSKIPLIQLDDYKSQQAQQLLNQAVNELREIPLLSGRLIENVGLVSGNNDIAHKLNRVYRGYLIIKCNAPVTIYDVAQINDDRVLRLNCSATATVSLWVF